MTKTTSKRDEDEDYVNDEGKGKGETKTKRRQWATGECLRLNETVFEANNSGGFSTGGEVLVVGDDDKGSVSFVG